MFVLVLVDVIVLSNVSYRCFMSFLCRLTFFKIVDVIGNFDKDNFDKFTLCCATFSCIDDA